MKDKQALVIVTILSEKRPALLRSLGIDKRRTTEISFIIDTNGKLGSRIHRSRDTTGITIDQHVARRIKACPFDELFLLALSNSSLGNRVASSIKWLFESRCEPQRDAAVVKSAIALESLLIFSESESLGRVLRERVAYILSDDPTTRQDIARIVGYFYEARSGIVHGSKKKQRRLSDSLLEAVDRMILLILLQIAKNYGYWKTSEDLNNWFEETRWGSSVELQRGFSKQRLNQALSLGSVDLSNND